MARSFKIINHRKTTERPMIFFYGDLVLENFQACQYSKTFP